MDETRLTRFSLGDGGGKIAPTVLERLLRDLPRNALPHPDLLIGLENGDNAAVYRLSDDLALVATTDFLRPIVDNAQDFGRIAAANAISGVHAMGARPILALEMLGMPVATLPDDAIRDVVRGGRDTCRRAGIALAGGHSIDLAEPVYGLAVIGMAHPAAIRRSDRGRAGDLLILGKPIGVGILSAALKTGDVSSAGYGALIATATQLNSVGMELAKMRGVHAMTGVAEFSVLGHVLDLCRGGLTARLSFGCLPVIEEAAVLARQGVVTGASHRNWETCAERVDLPADLPDWQRHLLTDPQTCGGLLVAVAPEEARAVLDLFHANGFGAASPIGSLEPGPSRIIIEP